MTQIIRRRSIPGYDPVQREYFADSFEAQKTCTMAINLIKQPKFLETHPHALLKMTISLLGESVIERELRRSKLVSTVLDKTEADELADKIGTILKKTLAPVLRKHILPLLIEYKTSLQTDSQQAPLFKRVRVLQATFKLNDAETEMLTFLYLIKNSPACEMISSEHGSFGFENFRRFKQAGHIPMGMTQDAWLRALQTLTSRPYPILDLSPHHLGISDDIIIFLSGAGDDDEFKSGYYSTANEERLRMRDFDRKPEEMEILERLLQRKEGCNILLFGAPGTGKTSFVRAIVKHLGKDLLTVQSEDGNNHSSHIRAISATAALTDPEQAVILIDEADEVLNSWNSRFFESRTKKSWINTFLDTHNKKIIWIVNRSSEIDPSSMRRFTFSLEFKNLSESKRLAILERELQQRDLNGKVPMEDIKALCRTHSVNADGVLKAVCLVDWEQEQDQAAAIRKVSCILENHEKAIGRRPHLRTSDTRFDAYSLSALNTSADLRAIVSASLAYSEKASTGSLPALTMLLHGQPGTGKTEFVNYLGYKMEKKVVLKRASDILSMWVGGTEQNIAEAFEAARDENGILFFDEADSFLYPRQEAVRSWEKTQTNELLTQLENASGIVIFATNFMQGLDHAALRRFRYKVEFKPLAPDGVMHLYIKMLSGFVGEGSPFSDLEKERLKKLQNLTPGDFKVVRDQLQYSDGSNTHEGIINALAQETSYKQNTKRPIGFISAS